jgi:hypothetical protein
LTHTTTSTVEHDQSGNVRGKIDVKETGRLRGERGKNPLLVAYERPEPTSGVPENRLLKWVLGKIRDDIDAVKETLSQSPVKSKLGSIAEEVIAALRHPYLEPLSVPDLPNQAMLDAAKRSRVEAHHHAFTFYNKRASRKNEDLETFIDLSSSSYIYPSQKDKIFELYLLFETLIQINESHTTDWNKIKIGGGTQSVAEFISNDVKVIVSYDVSPPSAFSWCDKSNLRYNNLFDTYRGISVSSRRPDILIEVKKPSGTVPVLMEAKWTNDENYIKDSMYKVLGYISDFEEVWGHDQVLNGYPKAILFIEDGLDPRPGLSWENALFESEVGVLSYAGDSLNSLGKLFSRLF